MMLVVICDIKFAFTITNIIVFNVASSCSRNTNIFVVHVFKSFPHFALFGILWLYRVLGVCIDYVSSVRVHCYFFFFMYNNVRYNESTMLLHQSIRLTKHSIVSLPLNIVLCPVKRYIFSPFLSC